ncbi:zf-HC2 domain-containing protein, partial [Halomonas sp. EGI 63088]
MKHRQIKDLLPHYIEDQLDDREREKVAAHLEHCPECQKEQEEYKMLLKAFNYEKQISPADRIRQRFYEQIEKEKQIQPKGVSLEKSYSKKSYGLGQLIRLAACIVLVIG